MAGGEEQAFQERLSEEITLLPGRISRYFFLLATLDTQASRIGDNLQVCRKSLLGDVADSTSGVHDAEHPAVEQPDGAGAEQRKRKTSGDVNGVEGSKDPGSCSTERKKSEGDVGVQLTALKELHSAQRQLLTDKLFVDRSAVEWFSRARNVVTSYTMDARLQRPKTDVRPHHRHGYHPSSASHNSASRHGYSSTHYHHHRYPPSQHHGGWDDSISSDLLVSDQTHRLHGYSGHRDTRAFSPYHSCSPSVSHFDTTSPLSMSTVVRCPNNMLLRHSSSGSSSISGQPRHGVGGLFHSTRGMAHGQGYAEEDSQEDAGFYDVPEVLTKKKRRVSSASQLSRSDIPSDTYAEVSGASNLSPGRDIKQAAASSAVSDSVRVGTKGASCGSRHSGTAGDGTGSAPRVRQKGQNRIVATTREGAVASACRAQLAGGSPAGTAAVPAANTASTPGSTSEGLIIKLGSQKGRPRKSFPATKQSSNVVHHDELAEGKRNRMKVKNKGAGDTSVYDASDAAEAGSDDLCPTCRKTASGLMVQCDQCDRWCHCACVGFVVDASAAEKPFYCPNCGDSPSQVSDHAVDGPQVPTILDQSEPGAGDTGFLAALDTVLEDTPCDPVS